MQPAAVARIREGSLTSGSLPPGISLRTDFPNFFNSSASAGLIGVATTPGTYYFTLTAASTGAASASQSFTMKITAFTLKDPYNTPDAFVGHAYSYQMTTLGAPQGSTITFGQCGTNPYNAPPGVTVSSSGLISGTPTAAGNYNLQFSINDGTDSVCHNINLLSSAILITATGPATGAFPNATQNSAYSATVSATGGSGSLYVDRQRSAQRVEPFHGYQRFRYHLPVLPTSTGKFNFTLTATDAGNSSFSYS